MTKKNERRKDARPSADQDREAARIEMEAALEVARVQMKKLMELEREGERTSDVILNLRLKSGGSNGG
jgi:hypothetical protein